MDDKFSWKNIAKLGVKNVKESPLTALIPVDPKDFFGMHEAVQKVHDFLLNASNLEASTRFILMVGESGSGKSSFLNVIKKIGEDEGFIVHQLPARLGIAGRTFLKELQSLMIPHLKTTRKRLFRRTSRDKEAPDITDHVDVKKIARSFVKELSKREFSPEVRMLIVIDNLERFVHGDFIVPLQLLPQLGLELKNRNIPVYLVGAIEQAAFLSMETKIGIQPFITMTNYHLDEADHFLLKFGPKIMKKDELRRFCIQFSDRTPFSLKYAIDLVNWAMKELKKEKKVREISNTTVIISKIEPFLKKMDLEEFVSMAYQLTPSERKIFEAFLNSPRNIVSLMELEQEIPNIHEHLRRLREKDLVYVEEDSQLACLTSQALYEKSRSQKGELAPDARTEVEILLHLMETALLSGTHPPKSILKRFEDLIISSNYPTKKIQAIISMTEKMFESSLLHGFHEEAFYFVMLLSKMKEIHGDNENAGRMLEESARTFIKLKKPQPAARLLKLAFDSYKKTGNLQKCKEVAELASKWYLNRAEEHLHQKPPQRFLARTCYYQALKWTRLLKDENLKKTVLKHIENTYANNTALKNQRLSFFKEIN